MLCAGGWFGDECDWLCVFRFVVELALEILAAPSLELRHLSLCDYGEDDEAGDESDYTCEDVP